jgi:hypothetical protein
MFDFLSNNWRFASGELGSPLANQAGVREQAFSVANQSYGSMHPLPPKIRRKATHTA